MKYGNGKRNFFHTSWMRNSKSAHRTRNTKFLFKYQRRLTRIYVENYLKTNVISGDRLFTPEPINYICLVHKQHTWLTWQWVNSDKMSFWQKRHTHQCSIYSMEICFFWIVNKRPSLFSGNNLITVVRIEQSIQTDQFHLQKNIAD